jgi:cytoskeletal protein CcmA (bactofilin family)
MRRRGSTDDWRETQTPAREVPARDSSRHGELTVIGAGARLEGNLVSVASLRIEGNVKGQVTAEGDVIVAPEAEVDSDVRAANVTIAGNYRGNVTANGTVELAPTARVDGNISCSSLIVNQGAMFSGQSIMDSSEAAQELADAEGQISEEETEEVK